MEVGVIGGEDVLLLASTEVPEGLSEVDSPSSKIARIGLESS